MLIDFHKNFTWDFEVEKKYENGDTWQASDDLKTIERNGSQLKGTHWIFGNKELTSGKVTL